MTYQLYILALMIAATIACALALLAWRRRPAPGSTELSLLLLAVALWSFATGLEAAADQRTAKLFFACLSYLGSQASPVLVFLFAVRYTQRDGWLTRSRTALLFVVPALSVVMAATNEWHRLLWTDVILRPVPGGVAGVFVHGPWFAVLLIYDYALLALSIIGISASVLQLPRFYFRQTLLLLVAALVPWLANAAYALNPTLIPGVDPTPIAFTVSAALLAWAFVRYRLLSVLPIARDRVIEEMDDAIIVLDGEGRIIDLNPVGRQLFDAPEASLFGQSFARVLAQWTRQAPGLPDGNAATVPSAGNMPIAVLPATQTELTLGEGAECRIFDLRVSQLHGRQHVHSSRRAHATRPEPALGQLVLIRDITARKKIEQEAQRRLSETLLLNRVIAAATSALETNAVLSAVCRELAHAFDLPQTACALLAADGTHLTVVAEYCAAGRPAALGEVIPLHDNMATQYVFEQREPLFVPNAQTDERQAVIHDLERRRGTVSLLIVPLVVRDRVIGTLGLDALGHREFSPEEIALIQSVAAAASSALENAQLYAAAQQELVERKRAEEQLARHARELEALYETALEITAQLDLTALLHAIVRRAASLLDAPMGGLYLVRPDAESLEMVVSHKLPGDLVGTVLRFGEGISGRVAETGSPLMVSDYQAWEGRAAVYAGQPFRRVLGVPLKISERVTGVLDITDDERTGQFSAEEVRLASMFADQAAIAVQNARLYGAAQLELAERRRAEEALQRSNKRLQGMQAIDRALMRAPAHEEPVDVAALRHIVELVPCTELDIITFDFATGQGTVVARISRGVVEARPGYAYPLERLPIERMRREQVIVQEIDSNLSAAPNLSDLYAVGIRSALAVALTVEEEPFGMFALLAETPDFFTTEYVEIAKEVAGQIALSLHQDRLNEQIWRHAQELELRVAERTAEIQQLSSLQRTIVEHADLGIISTTPAGIVQTFNPAAERMLGYAAAEIVGAATPALWHDAAEMVERAREFTAELGSAVAPDFSVFVARSLRGLPNTYEWTYVGKDGSRFPVLLTVSTLWTDDGSVRGFVGVATDITERKEAESALQNLTRRLELATRAGKIGIWDFDVRHDYLVWDDRMYDMYGIDPAQFTRVREAWLRAVHPDDLERVETISAAALRGERPYETEFRVVRPDGAIRHFKASALVLKDERGSPERFIGVNWDITESKQVEEALTRYAQEIEDLYNHAPCGYHSLDAAGNIVRINDTELNWLGYARTEMNGRKFVDFLTAERRPQFETSLLRPANRDFSGDLEYEMVRHDGTLLPVLLSTSSVHAADGTFLESRATMFDISERRAADLKLRASEAAMREANRELSRAVRLKDEFLANMSHELRTPLNAILSLTESLAEGIYGGVNTKQQEALGYITESGQHLLGLINDILDLTKVEAGKLALQLERVDVDALCQASLRLVKQQAHEKHLSVTYTIGAGISTVIADERRLKQIIVNLLSNAVKFTPDGGRIGLEVAGDPDAQILRFTVWDTGIGISTSQLGVLFRPFVQLDSTLARHYSGTGLGLALVRRLTDLYGGSVEVESEEGQGSRFTVKIPWRLHDSGLADDSEPGMPQAQPAASAEAPSTTPAAGNPVAGSGPGPESRVVLVAEDNEVNMMSYRDYLRVHGFAVVEAWDGAEAVACAERHLPDLIIMDIQMPRMDGLEAIRAIRGNQALALTPIIAVTALAMRGDRERCLAAGASEYLSKPVNLKLLVREMERLLRQRRALGTQTHALP